MQIAFFEITDEVEKNIYSNALSPHKLDFYEQPLTETYIPNKTDYDILVTFTNCEVNENVLSHYPSLTGIVARSTGFDNIDLKSALRKNITVCNIPSYGSRTVAEFTFGLILTLTRHIYQGIYRTKKEQIFSANGLCGIDLYNKTLGVIGTGKIGKNVIEIAKGFNMHILAYSKHPSPDLTNNMSVTYTDLNTLLANSDIITIHVPHTSETHHLLNKNNIPLIKKTSIIINTARGAIIDTYALYTALSSSKIAGAALDVLEEETELKEEAELINNQMISRETYQNILKDHLLIKLPNVIVTPHMAYFSKEAEETIRQVTIANIIAITKNVPQNIVELK